VQAHFQQDTVCSFAKATAPRRLLAFFAWVSTCGVFVRLNCDPSTATKRHPRQNASPWVAGTATGRNNRRNNSSNTTHGSRCRRFAQELSANDSPVNSKKCSASVPTSCITWKISAGSSSVNGIRGGRPGPGGRRGSVRRPTNRCQAWRNPTGGCVESARRWEWARIPRIHTEIAYHVQV
jgi:hypothetical protein